jgi:hypothetical protein
VHSTHPLLDTAVPSGTARLAAARFAPGMRGGVAVKSRTWLELKFHPLVPPGVAAAESDPTPR